MINQSGGSVFSKLFGKGSQKSQSDDLADKLYQILVNEPPSSVDPNALGPSELGINLSELSRYSEKRTALLEAMLLFSAVTANDGNEAPLVKSITVFLKSKWKERGLSAEIASDLHDLCWPEIEHLLESPVKWAKAWLNEFYPNEGDYGPHLYEWASQCQREYEAMVAIISEYKGY